VVPGGEVLIRYAAFVEPEIPALPRILHEDGPWSYSTSRPACSSTRRTPAVEQHGPHSPRDAPRGEDRALARLDRETSGLLLGQDGRRQPRLAAMFASGEIEKTYRALVRGLVTPPRELSDQPLGTARRLDVLFRRSAAAIASSPPGRTSAYCAATPATRCSSFARGRAGGTRSGAPGGGRPPHRRRQALRHGRQVLLKLVREGLDAPDAGAARVAPQLLHAAALELVHPDTGRPVRFVSPLPPDFADFLETLETPQARIAA